jgi:hypothetical protein
MVATIDYCIFTGAHDAQALPCTGQIRLTTSADRVTLTAGSPDCSGNNQENGQEEKAETLSRCDRGEGTGPRTRWQAADGKGRP